MANIAYYRYKAKAALWYQEISESLWMAYILAAYLLFVDAWLLGR